jgi:hypothetical protein
MTQVTLSSNVLFHHYGSEGILLNLDTETYFTLNETGIRMWEILSSTPSVDDAATQLADEYDAPLDTIRTDLEEFIQTLRKAQLIEENA